MTRKTFVWGLALAGAMTATLLAETDAAACGGCFHPPTESPTVVTDHRMILTISPDRSTLYDQIRYTGSPGSFAWVLPIAGTVDIGLSSNLVFQALDQMTQTQIIAPPMNCPQRPDDCQNEAFASDSAGRGGADAGAGSVQVLKQEVVGPYETVQLASDDPNALNTWLTDNGFAITDDVKPVVAQYINEKFNFLALKLVPGKGVQDMRPVRVTTIGAGAVLPLRMVAAGTGPVVGITLWTIAEGRYEPQNFPSFYIATDEILWDWTAQKSNYVELRAAKTAAGNGRIWETENSQILYRQNVDSVVKQGTWDGTGTFPQTDEERAASEYPAVVDEQGNTIKTSAQLRDEDLDALFYGIPTSTSRITRLRADLNHAALDQDLAMTASADQAVLPTTRQLTRELNEPQCPVWDGCEQDGTAPRSEAVDRSSGGGTFACSAAPRTTPTWLAAGGGFLGLAIIHASRRRRAHKTN